MQHSMLNQSDYSLAIRLTHPKKGHGNKQNWCLLVHCRQRTARCCFFSLNFAQMLKCQLPCSPSEIIINSEKKKVFTHCRPKCFIGASFSFERKFAKISAVKAVSNSCILSKSLLLVTCRFDVIECHSL